MEYQLQAIRETIAQAKAQEQNTGQLTAILKAALPSLHNAIELPQKNGLSALFNFVVLYIERVPDNLEAITILTKNAGIYDYSGVFFNIAQDYFLNPPKMIAEYNGLIALMGEAYLAHRLMEEVNDRIIGRCGIPLAPMDMTRANLIIHSLIGEPFANELDLAVQFSTEMLMDKEHVLDGHAFQVYVKKHKVNGWSKELQRWPCLATDLSIMLNFNHSISPETAH